MSEDTEDNQTDAVVDEATLNEEASRELEALVAAEAPAPETEFCWTSKIPPIRSASTR